MPNIIGALYQRSSAIDNLGSITRTDGAFYNVDSRAAYENTAIVNATASTVKADRINFNASSSNSIYGNSTTVQPPAVKLLPCIKAYSDIDNLGSCDVAQLENYVQNNCVHLTGDERIHGFKKFDRLLQLDGNDTGTGIANNPFIVLKSKHLVKGSYPPVSEYCGGVVLQAAAEGDWYSGFMTWGNANRFNIALYNFAKNEMSVSLDQSDTYTSFAPNPDNAIQLGATANRWKQLYAATSSISTSDERLKSSVASIPDEILDVWGQVGFVQFQFNDAFAEKGSDARLHSGLVAQSIDAAFKAAGLDASRYGFFCHDQWDAQEEVHDENGRILESARDAGDMYSLRYEEALCMEAAYQRRENRRLKEKVASLEERLASLEEKLK